MFFLKKQKNLFNSMRSTFELPPSVSYEDDFEAFTKQNMTGGMEIALLDGGLSSTTVLIVVLTIIFSLVMTSLLTYCFHKWKLRVKKLQRAQEEYERDQEKSMSSCAS